MHEDKSWKRRALKARRALAAVLRNEATHAGISGDLGLTPLRKKLRRIADELGDKPMRVPKSLFGAFKNYRGTVLASATPPGKSQ